MRKIHVPKTKISVINLAVSISPLALTILKSVTEVSGRRLPLGYRACQIALSRLYPGEIPPRGDQFVVSGSNKACPADSVSFITGARYGKASNDAFNGNLAFDESVGFFDRIKDATPETIGAAADVPPKVQL